MALHFGSSVGISIRLVQSRARIPVGIGAAEVSASDHDEIAQLVARLGITVVGVQQEYIQIAFFDLRGVCGFAT